MARGYPDYFGQSMWPKYGTPIEVDLLETDIPHGEELDVVSILGQGILFNLKATLVETEASNNAYLDLYVDGTLMATISQVYSQYDNPMTAIGEVLVPIYRSINYGELIVGLTREVPFRYTLIVKARNLSRGMLNCSGKVHYYVVT